VLNLSFPREELPDVLCVKFGLPLDGFLVGLEVILAVCNLLLSTTSRTTDENVFRSEVFDHRM